MNAMIHVLRVRRGQVFVLLIASMFATTAQATCTVSASGVLFGGYDVFSASPNDSAGSVSVDCDPATPYTISLSAGGGTYSQRHMSTGTDLLGYNLYTDASRSIVWGDGSSGTGTVGGSAASENHTVYGRVPAGQNVPAGSYGDTIMITISF